MSLAAIQFGTSQGHDAAFRRLMLLHEKNPEALILATAAAELLQMAREKIDHPDLRPCRKLFQEMADLSERAAIAHAPRRLAGRLSVASPHGDRRREPAEDHAGPIPGTARIRDHLHAMIADGRRWPEDRREGLNALLMMIVADLTQDQARDWNLATPEGGEPWRQGRKQLHRYGRNLVEDWLEDQPGDAEVLGWLKKLDTSMSTQGVIKKEVR